MRRRRKIKRTITTHKVAKGLYCAIEKETQFNAYGSTRHSAKRTLLEYLEAGLA